MTGSFFAVYEGGVLRPKAPLLGLEEGSQVEVVILNLGHKSPAEILADIAAMPTKEGDPHTSRDHDKVLYEDGA